jgi:hypothetical protein
VSPTDLGALCGTALELCVVFPALHRAGGFSDYSSYSTVKVEILNTVPIGLPSRGSHSKFGRSPLYVRTDLIPENRSTVRVNPYPIDLSPKNQSKELVNPHRIGI